MNKKKKNSKIVEEKKIENEEIEETEEHSGHPILKTFIFLIIVLTFTFLYARYIEPKLLIVKEYPINITKENSSHLDGLKIAHFSDIHYGSTVTEKELTKMVEKVNKQNPDIIVFTGDLTDKKTVLTDDEINKVREILNKLKPKIETLAVIGNHDYENNYWEKIVPNLNWITLDNTYEYVYRNNSTPIVFIGLDDLTKGNPDYKNAFSYLNETEEELYTVVLMHEPDQIEKIDTYKYDLVLSGHSHLGQVRIPFLGAIWTPTGSKKYFDEQYIINDASLYINGGIGTSVLKLRFLNTPSINLYRFYTE